VCNLPTKVQCATRSAGFLKPLCQEIDRRNSYEPSIKPFEIVRVGAAALSRALLRSLRLSRLAIDSMSPSTPSTLQARCFHIFSARNSLPLSDFQFAGYRDLALKMKIGFEVNLFFDMFFRRESCANAAAPKSHVWCSARR
jgi:hypothetical protein